MTCKLCKKAHDMKLFDCGLKTDGAFITAGFRSWAKALERFSKHEESVTHRTAVSRIKSSSEPSATSMMSATGKAKDVAEAREALDKVFGAIAYLAGQGLPMRRREEETGNLQRLLDQFERNCPALKKWRKRKLCLPTSKTRFWSLWLRLSFETSPPMYVKTSLL